jgi:hypothetical protein
MIPATVPPAIIPAVTPLLEPLPELDGLVVVGCGLEGKDLAELIVMVVVEVVVELA